MYFEDFVIDTVIIGWLRDPLGLLQQVCVWWGWGGAGWEGAAGCRNQGVDARGCELISNLIPISLSPDDPNASSGLSSLQCVFAVNLLLSRGEFWFISDSWTSFGSDN